MKGSWTQTVAQVQTFSKNLHSLFSDLLAKRKTCSVLTNTISWSIKFRKNYFNQLIRRHCMNAKVKYTLTEHQANSDRLPTAVTSTHTARYLRHLCAFSDLVKERILLIDREFNEGQSADPRLQFARQAQRHGTVRRHRFQVFLRQRVSWLLAQFAYVLHKEHTVLTDLSPGYLRCTFSHSRNFTANKSLSGT